ncbi:MAG: DsbA family protein [Phycisphaerales bacterium]
MAALTVPVSDRDHVQGSLKAPIVLVEYGDYQCPHCAAAYPIVKRIQKDFGDRLAFVFRNFPLTEIHPNAERAAEAAEYAAGHDRYWEMHDGIFENQPELDLDLLSKLAASLGMDAAGLETALAEGKFSHRVRADFVGGVRSGVNGTPTFFINGKRHDGPFEFRDLAEALNGLTQ